MSRAEAGVEEGAEAGAEVEECSFGMGFPEVHVHCFAPTQLRAWQKYWQPPLARAARPLQWPASSSVRPPNKQSLHLRGLRCAESLPLSPCFLFGC